MTGLSLLGCLSLIYSESILYSVLRTPLVEDTAVVLQYLPRYVLYPPKVLEEIPLQIQANSQEREGTLGNAVYISYSVMKIGAC